MLCNVRSAFDQFNLISGLHSFMSDEDIDYKNILPPLSLLNNKDKKRLLEDLNKLNFNIGSLKALKMQLARFLNKLFKKDGFILVDGYSKKYIIGQPKNKIPITIKILDQKLHYKLLFRPDLYFGEAYCDGKIIIENGTLIDFLDLTLMNLGRNDFNFLSKL